MVPASKARLVNGELVIPPLTRREEAEALMDPDIFEVMSKFVTLSAADKQKVLAVARGLLRDTLAPEAAST